MFLRNSAFLLVSATLLLGTTSGFAQDAQPGRVVGICEVQPDFYDGNCPPAVQQTFSATGAADGQQVADVAVALGQRLQQAEADNDVGLCIDLAEGILQAATYANDPTQRDAIVELARSSCCVVPQGVAYGQLLGTAINVPLTGTRRDGTVTSGSATFMAADASFVADGVRPGDMLVITSGGQQGFYLIDAALDANSLSLSQTDAVKFPGWLKSEAGLTFEVRRPAPGDNSCEPGTSTASVVVPALPIS